MSEDGIKALYYKENNIGNWMKKSKKQYIWKIQVDGETHHIEFLDSVLSGKKKILKNGMVVFERQLFGVPFQYPFTIGKHSFNIAMHGDRYELRVDGMSFSHLYNLTKSQQYGGGQEDEDNSMGAYADTAPASSYPTRQKKYDDYDSSPPSKYKSNNDDDPWKEKKYGSRDSPSKSDEDTGYDGWNDVKKTGSRGNKIPDPYAKKASKYDPYPEDDFVAGKAKTARGKTTKTTKKNDDFFSGGFDKPAKKKEFDENSQPKTFDFDGFEETVDKKNKPDDDFENAFNDPPKKKNTATVGDDPFNWDNEQPMKKAASKNDAFEFDFDNQNNGQQKNASTNDFFEEEVKQQEEPKKETFDPFALDETPAPVSSDPVEALADVKFDSDPFPQVDSAPALDPVISEENPHNPPPLFTKEEPKEEWTEEKLFNLNNITKNKPEPKKPEENTNGFGNSNFNSNFEGGAFGNAGGSAAFPLQTSAPETKEDKLNALENAFGSVETDVAVAQAHASMAQATMAQNPPQPAGFNQPPAAQNDFGEFPTMFGSTPEGFGNFQGFESNAFGAGAPAQNPAQAPPVAAAQSPAQTSTDPFGAPQPQKADNSQKKDDWFEF